MKIAHIVSDTIRIYGFVGVGMTLFEEVCHLECALRFEMLKPRPVSSSISDALESKYRTLSYLF